MRRLLSSATFLSVLTLADCRQIGEVMPSADPELVLPGGRRIHRSDVLDAFGQCVFATARTFETKAEALVAATNGTDRDAARGAWRDAIDVWQRAEMMQFGPAASIASPGGANLRDNIYAFPFVSRCLVDTGIVGDVWKAADFKDALGDTRTLYAAEYLLFYDGTDNACASAANINATGSWAALGPDLAARKMAYAHGAAADVLARARTLTAAWDPTNGNFVRELREAGRGSQLFSTQASALNAVSDALFYLDFNVKDVKLGKPLGIYRCTKGTCPVDPKAVESIWAARSKEHVRNNLLGFRSLYSGCGENGAGIGWDDLLAGIGRGEAADRITSALAAAFAAIDAIAEPDFAPALISSPEKVRTLYDRVKVLADLVKTDLVTAADLEIPMKVEGDND